MWSSGKVKNQDALFQFVIGIRGRDTRKETRRFIQKNWPGVQGQLAPHMGGHLVDSLGEFCRENRVTEIQSFLASHPAPATERALVIATTRIHDCVQLRTAQGENLKQYLAHAQ
jgi:hypothetical protein